MSMFHMDIQKDHVQMKNVDKILLHIVHTKYYTTILHYNRDINGYILKMTRGLICTLQPSAILVLKKPIL